LTNVKGTLSVPFRSWSRSRSRARLAGVGAALALAIAPAANAVSITNLVVAFDPGNTANLFDDAGGVARQISSQVGVLSSSATNFITRYQAGVNVDTGPGGGGEAPATTVITLNAAYHITFDIIDAVGTNWQLDIASSRVGARTSITDGNGTSAFSLGAVTGVNSGVGTLSGSLGLASIARATQGNSQNLAFNQTGTGTITGSGNGTVTLTFNFTATAETILGPGASTQGDEAAVRLGMGENLTSYTAGAYPGSGNRNPANDGHFIDLDLIDLGPIPEPDTGLLVGSGLAALGLRRSRTRRAQRS
jgi:hypothetical protein